MGTYAAQALAYGCPALLARPLLADDDDDDPREPTVKKLAWAWKYTAAFAGSRAPWFLPLVEAFMLGTWARWRELRRLPRAEVCELARCAAADQARASRQKRR